MRNPESIAILGTVRVGHNEMEVGDSSMLKSDQEVHPCA